MTRYLCLALVFALLATDSAAQDLDRFTFSGEIRHRTELDNRFTDQETSFFHLLRTRLNARAEATPDIDVFVQVQDSRVFGGGNPTLGAGTLDPEAGAVSLHQAYFEIRELLNTPLRLRVGRQQLALGNQRLVGAVNWSNVGRSFDAARLTYEKGRATIDGFAARLTDGPGQTEASRNFFGIYTTWQLTERHELEVYGLLQNDTEQVSSGQSLVQFTPGATLRGGFGPLQYELEGALQTGERNLDFSFDDPSISLNANFQSARLLYTLNERRQVTIEGGFTRLSGDEAGSFGGGAFSTLFATNHQFYGFMDYFPTLFTASGLQNAFGVVAGNLTDDVRLRLAVHNFRTDADLSINPGPLPGPEDAAAAGSLRGLGQEIDLTLSYQPHPRTTFSGGVSTFFSDTAMELAIGDGTPFWGYVMTTIRF